MENRTNNKRIKLEIRYILSFMQSAKSKYYLSYIHTMVTTTAPAIKMNVCNVSVNITALSPPKIMTFHNLCDNFLWLEKL